MTVIKDIAFAFCSSLSSVNFDAASHLATIGAFAFWGDAALTDITIPSSVQTIGDNAFRGDAALTDITIPSSVTSIGNGVFSYSGISRCIIYSNTAMFGGSDVFYDTNISSDGIYGYEGSTAQAYAADYDIPFIPFLALTPSPSSLEIYTGKSITVTPNVAGGEWAFDSTLLSRNGNEFTGLKPGTAHVTYTAGWQSESVDIAISQGLTLTSSSSDNNIYTGGRITITPSIPGGSWTYDHELLSLSGNEFTGLKAGTAHVTYTAGEQSESVDVVILQSNLPQTGQDSSPVLLLLTAAALTGGAALASLILKRRRQRVG